MDGTNNGKIEMKAIITALLLLILGSNVASAASAPNFKAMSLDQIEAYFAGKTILMHGRYGNDVYYFRSNGKLYMATSGYANVAKTDWSVIVDDKLVSLCLLEVNVRVPHSGGAKARSRFCVEAKQFLREAKELAAGDVLGISKRSKVPGGLPASKMSLAKLQAALRR